MTELLDTPDQHDLADSRYRLVDCDVHPIMRGGMGDLRPFLSRAAQRRLGLDDRRDLTTSGHREAVSIPRNMLYVNQAGVLRDDARAPDGSAPGADPQFTAEQLLDANGIDRAVLIGGELLGLGAMPDPDAAATIASAYNDWLAATWLSADDRYRANLVVGAQDPAAAAAEIRRVANDRRFVGGVPPLAHIFVGPGGCLPGFEGPARGGG